MLVAAVHVRVGMDESLTNPSDQNEFNRLTDQPTNFSTEGQVSENKLVTKTQIVDIVAEGTGLTKVETSAVIDGFLATINWAVSNDARVTLRGFGSFNPVHRRSRLSRNPQTGEKMEIPAYRAVVFRPAKELRESVKHGLPEKEPAPALP